jgi:CheY-like chemotaxis protein
VLGVQDFGRGITKDFLPRLFDRFSQSDLPGQRVQGGLGLGLSIVRHIAELHGGTVRAESAGLGKGATMHVTLNVEGTAEDEGVPSEPGSMFGQDEIPGDRPLDGLRVLVVEDDADASEMLQVILSDRGAQVRTATDYDSALAAMRAQWPDLLVSDIGLPVRDGYDLIGAVRSLAPPPGAHRLAAVALTAFARPEDRERALRAGFDDHVAKPLNAHALVSAIRAALADGRPAG